jgi:hypothetical protein
VAIWQPFTLVASDRARELASAVDVLCARRPTRSAVVIVSGTRSNDASTEVFV